MKIFQKYFAKTQADLQNSHQIVQLGTLDAEEIVHHEGPGPLVPPHCQVGPLGTRIEEIYHLDNIDYYIIYIHNSTSIYV